VHRVAYSDQPSPRLDRIVGVAVWLVAAFLLIFPMITLLVEGCFWEEGCSSSQVPRFLGAFVAALAVAVPLGWSACRLVGWLIQRPGR
jgi:ABC-type Fe3+ transport system permease subunit